MQFGTNERFYVGAVVIDCPAVVIHSDFDSQTSRCATDSGMTLPKQSLSPNHQRLGLSRFSLTRLLTVASVAIFAVVIGKAWTPPVHAAGEPTIVSVSVGENSACALLADTTVRCWGNNYNGELGDGTFIDKASPQVVPGLTGVTSLVMGARHVCAAITGGAVKCWG